MNRKECNKHDCDEMLEKVMMALDGAYSHEQEKQFLKDIQHCSCCLEIYDIEKNFKTFLCRKVHRKKVSEDLVNGIKNKISLSIISGKD
ncbi:MAG: hypothetical protein EA412_09720 [Chitinophagaceae bacterium]|nr:MAG: hypothetical protein EA412_09720 [Chitinophagaceae bacterium]